jgi:heme/copper-type cytochrome/quinol oxidase subunit 2
MVTGNLRSFVLMFIIGAVILFVAGLLAYTLSRALIWNYLLKEKFSIKKYLKFNCLNLIMLIAIVIILGIYSLLMLLNRTIFSFILVLLVLGVMYFAFNAKINFTKTGKIFESIGNAFKKINRNVYLFCLIPFIAVMLITFATSFVLSQLLNTIASMILIIAFSSWMRIFILKTQE